MAAQIILPHLPWIIAGGMVIAIASIAGWVYTTNLRIRNGYPLESSWGKPIEPRTHRAEAERIRLLSAENAQLQAEIGSLKDRMATVERIVTDDGHRIAAEIDQLRVTRN